MSVIDRVPVSTRGRWLMLSAAAVAWVAAYRVNGWLWGRILYHGLGLNPKARLTQTIHFFCFDTVKIGLLLVGIIFVVTVLRSYMSVERTRALLGGRREGVGNVAAAGLGVITPFCSCSAVPAFIGFVAAGVPIGVTLSFLIASPLVNEIAVGMLFSMFGWQIAALYITAGLSIAILAGWVLGRLGVQRWALTELNITAQVQKIEDYPTIVGYGVMSTPALVIDDKVVLSGRVPSVAQIRELLTGA